MSSVTTALFDLDGEAAARAWLALLIALTGCLYAADNGLEEHCRRRIYEFMVLRCGVEDVTLAESVWTVAFRI